MKRMVASLLLLFVFSAGLGVAQAGWDKTGVKSDGVSYYDSNSDGLFLQSAVSGGTYNNVASPDGTVTSGWDAASVQAGVAYGVSTGNYQLKQSSDSSWYLITDILDWF